MAVLVSVSIVSQPPDLILLSLQKILASVPFARSPRLARFLSYLVERAIAGAEDDLREYSIGVSVFDRATDYDQRLDPIVRVEAPRFAPCRIGLETHLRVQSSLRGWLQTTQRINVVEPKRMANRTHARYFFVGNMLGDRDRVSSQIHVKAFLSQQWAVAPGPPRAPDGLALELVGTKAARDDRAYQAGPVPLEFAVRGVHSATLPEANPVETAALLTNTMGFKLCRKRGEGKPETFATSNSGAGAGQF